MRKIFESVQWVIMSGRHKSETFAWNWIIYPLCYLIFMFFWLIDSPKDLFKYLSNKKEEINTNKIVNFEDMQSTKINFNKDRGDFIVDDQGYFIWKEKDKL
jgi:hypothetical protein